jgi:hypothetical protein
LNPVIENDNQINNKNKNMATKTKTTKKVTTAKGKGKAPKAKVVKKTAKPATKKAVAKKPAVKKAPKIVDPNKYGKFVIEDAFTEKYPEMVVIAKAPAAYSSLVGKKYVSRERFITFIESEKAEASIDKGAKSVLKEMDAAGIVPLDVENI